MLRKNTEIDYTQLRHLSPYIWRDTQLRTLYRLYECTVTDCENEMMEESQYWFHQQAHWRLVDIPDPKDPDSMRYLVLACLADALVSSFNWKIRLGLRRVITCDRPWLIWELKQDPNPPLKMIPPWTRAVGRLEEPLILAKLYGRDENGPFRKRNVFAHVNQLWNV